MNTTIVMASRPSAAAAACTAYVLSYLPPCTATSSSVTTSASAQASIDDRNRGRNRKSRRRHRRRLLNEDDDNDNGDDDCGGDDGCWGDDDDHDGDYSFEEVPAYEQGIQQRAEAVTSRGSRPVAQGQQQSKPQSRERATQQPLGVMSVSDRFNVNGNGGGVAPDGMLREGEVERNWGGGGGVVEYDRRYRGLRQVEVEMKAGAHRGTRVQKRWGWGPRKLLTADHYDYTVDPGADVLALTVGAAAFEAALPPFVRIVTEEYEPADEVGGGVQMYEALGDRRSTFNLLNLSPITCHSLSERERMFIARGG